MQRRRDLGPSFSRAWYIVVHVVLSEFTWRYMRMGFTERDLEDIKDRVMTGGRGSVRSALLAPAP